VFKGCGFLVSCALSLANWRIGRLICGLPAHWLGNLICDHVKRGKANRKALAARADATYAPYLAVDSAGLAPPPGLPITRKVGVGLVVAAIIAGMLVLMGIINDIEDGPHDLNETSQK
jgi:hypothetical protein